jgi:hypothetical protein
MEFTRTNSKIDLRAQARMITTICLLGGVDVQIVDPIQVAFLVREMLFIICRRHCI